ncbi:putative esterase F42H10.6 [Cylas formicarius]|uniref:putative esterase F42H10.6 n=1 Tax=Cylas formicarius TaxID=197179 RepID=UPI0029585222|nr:putative esterase F42H10.6 [Cylas formicarius]
MPVTATQLSNLLKGTKRFDQVLNKVKILKLEQGKCEAELTLDEEHTNIYGGLHGGLSATLVDSISSYALMSHEHGQMPNVSINLNIEFLKAAKLGDNIKIIAETLRVGRTIASLEVLIKNESGDLLVKGSHTKFLKFAEPEFNPSNVNFQSIDHGNALADFIVEEEHTNPLGTLHGGFSATLVDSVSSFALSTHDKVGCPHVSVDIHLTYYSSANVGDHVEIEANTIKAGRSMAFLEVLIKNKNTGVLLLRGLHSKYLMRGK